MPHLLLLLACLVPQAVAVACSPEFSPCGGACYKAFKSEGSFDWLSAKDKCEGMRIAEKGLDSNVYLATIRDKAQKDCIKTMVKAIVPAEKVDQQYYVWTGLKMGCGLSRPDAPFDELLHMHWQGDLSNYQKWLPNEPNGYRFNLQACALYDTKRDGFATVFCDMKHDEHSQRLTDKYNADNVYYMCEENPNPHPWIAYMNE